MKILVLQETDWLTRGPHTQHHIFERLSKNPLINVTVLDYDIDKILKSESRFIKKQIYNHIDRAIKNSNVKIIRTAHLQIPFVRRISSLVTNFFEILKIIRKNRPEIIVGFSITNGLIGLLLSKFFRIPYIFYIIDLLHTLVPIKYFQSTAKIVIKFLFKFSDQIIVVTKLLQKFVINEGASPRKIKLLLNGISLENTIINEEKLKNLKSELSFSDNDFIIFFMGYLYDFAGLKEIIDYYNSDVKEGKYPLKFLIVGDGGIYNSLKNHITDIGADWVILTGRVPFFDITEYIQLADLCLMSFKLNEITKNITPVKIMEYLAMRKPVLSNKLPGVVLEIGTDNGVIYSKNQEELIKNIAQLSKNKNKLRKIGEKGFTLIRKKYDWKNIINDFKRALIETIKDKIQN